jgi:hypothetical protein
MPDRNQIDIAHSRAMATAIGEMLREILAGEESESPAEISDRVDRLREREGYKGSPSIVPPSARAYRARPRPSANYEPRYARCS